MKGIDEITIEEVEELYMFLQGEMPKRFSIREMSNLSPKQAFAVIYYLQEGLGVIPDKYELCTTEDCNTIFDSECEGCMAGLCQCCYENMCPHCGDGVDCEDCVIYQSTHGEGDPHAD